MTLETNNQNNLIFKTNFSKITGIESIKQDIRHRLLMWQTEYPFNINEGLPWYDLANSNDKNALKIAVKKRILEDARIKSVLALEISFLKGELQLVATLKTTEGIVNV